MNDSQLSKIEKLLERGKPDDAQLEIAKLGPEYYKNAEYLYLRGKIFFSKKLYYLAIDAALISLEFSDNDKVYKLIAEIYSFLGNKELSKKLLDANLRKNTITLLKNELSGIYRKET